MPLCTINIQQHIVRASQAQPGGGDPSVLDGGGGGRGSWRPRTRGVAPPREAQQPARRDASTNTQLVDAPYGTQTCFFCMYALEDGYVVAWSSTSGRWSGAQQRIPSLVIWNKQSRAQFSSPGSVAHSDNFGTNVDKTSQSSSFSL